MQDTVLRDLRRGERNAVENLYKSAFPYCSSMILKNNGTMENAKDLFQESILVLFTNVRKPDFKLTCDVKTYLYSIMRNLWLKHLREKSKSGNYTIRDDHKEYISINDEELEIKRETEEKHLIVQQAMELLKDDCKQLLLSYYFKKIPLGEIAEFMDYSYQFVKVKKNRCMNYLKEEVKKLRDK